MWWIMLLLTGYLLSLAFILLFVAGASIVSTRFDRSVEQDVALLRRRDFRLCDNDSLAA